MTGDVAVINVFGWLKLAPDWIASFVTIWPEYFIGFLPTYLVFSVFNYLMNVLHELTNTPSIL